MPPRASNPPHASLEGEVRRRVEEARRELERRGVLLTLGPELQRRLAGAPAPGDDDELLRDALAQLAGAGLAADSVAGLWRPEVVVDGAGAVPMISFSPGDEFDDLQLPKAPAPSHAAPARGSVPPPPGGPHGDDELARAVDAHGGPSVRAALAAGATLAGLSGRAVLLLCFTRTRVGRALAALAADANSGGEFARAEAFAALAAGDPVWPFVMAQDALARLLGPGAEEPELRRFLGENDEPRTLRTVLAGDDGFALAAYSIDAHAAPPPRETGEVRRVRLERTTQAWHDVYRGPDAPSARSFLEALEVNEPCRYVVVETPGEGTWGRDLDGVYLERLLPWQLVRGEGPEPAPRSWDVVSSRQLGAAARGFGDNFSVRVGCGRCACEWLDGVAYQGVTRVRCPRCRSLSAVDTRNLSVP